MNEKKPTSGAVLRCVGDLNAAPLLGIFRCLAAEEFPVAKKKKHPVQLVETRESCVNPGEEPGENPLMIRRPKKKTAGRVSVSECVCVCVCERVGILLGLYYSGFFVAFFCLH